MSGVIFDSKSVLPNGTLINGVANFYTATKPTTRVDGSALVIGDLWFNPSTGTQGYWNGTYWLTTYTVDGLVGGSAFALTATATFTTPASIRTGATFLERILIYYARATGVLNGSNRYDLTFAEARNDGLNGTAIVGSFSINADGDPAAVQANIAVNSLLSTGIPPLVGLRTICTAVGTPGSVRLVPIPVFRYVL